MQYWMQSEIYATIQCLTHCITLGVVISGQNNIKKNNLYLFDSPCNYWQRRRRPWRTSYDISENKVKLCLNFKKNVEKKLTEELILKMFKNGQRGKVEY